MPRKPKSTKPPPATKATEDSNVMVLSEGLATSAWFPFFILAFATLGATFSLVAWSLPRVRAGEYYLIPVLLAGVAGMVLSPVIGHFLNTCVLAAVDAVGRWILSPLVEEDEEERGVARGLVAILLGLVAAVGWLAVEVWRLKREAGVLRAEIAYVAMRDAAAHAEHKGWFA